MLALLAFVELDVTLTAIAIGLSLRDRPRPATFGVTALAAIATGLALVLAWLVWLVAPACVADPNVLTCTAGRAGFGALAYLAEVTALEWAWMLGVALLARSMPARAGVGG
ncbi:MAG TPA: hypothetical protein VKE27_07085 [Candidatus Dormibacteraeota bacterium]|nr:hypothetical protein [Candidatus Dormibacteraeota bacterium]